MARDAKYRLDIHNIIVQYMSIAPTTKSRSITLKHILCTIDKYGGDHSKAIEFILEWVLLNHTDRDNFYNSDMSKFAFIMIYSHPKTGRKSIKEIFDIAWIVFNDIPKR